jgi:ankyrin repeat protein
MRLASGKRTRVTAAEQDQLLVLPEGIAAIDLAAAGAVKRNLAAIGVAWSVPRGRILELHKAKHDADAARIADALTPDERALFEAARANAARQVGVLLARGVGVDVRTVEGQWKHTPAGDTPLIQACKQGAREAALALVAGGADPNARNRFEQTGLLWAARAGFRDVVAACLAAGGDPNLADTSEEAPLLWAAQAGDVEMVERLIAAGAEIQRRTHSGVTAGERAGMHAHYELAKRLG